MAVTTNVERKGVEINWDASESGDDDEQVTVYTQGSDGKWHNTASMPNDGKALISYPADFSGESLVEIRDSEGNVLDSGTITVG